MKFKQLGKRYPKAFDVFIDKMNLDYDYIMDADVRCYWKEITDFMDKQEVIITTHYITYHLAKPCFAIDIKNTKNLILFSTILSNKRSVAETKAIDKAFEILEERSNK